MRVKNKPPCSAPARQRSALQGQRGNYLEIVVPAKVNLTELVAGDGWFFAYALPHDPASFHNRGNELKALAAKTVVAIQKSLEYGVERSVTAVASVHVLRDSKVCR